ncbi:tripartite tricarboxylate transporter TctB family protein [Aliamphritea spongicola]|nr:tripartite tricarboxylate transporter TctB family protein [Aliamphritea spongicola]
MTITKDHIGGLVFLCLSVAYGYYARDIPLLPGDEFEPFTARSVPNALAWIGGVLSLALIVTAKSDTANTLRLAGLDFGLVSKLLILVVLFGLALDWLGFLLATVLFLIAGYWLLGTPAKNVAGRFGSVCGRYLVCTDPAAGYLSG